MKTLKFAIATALAGVLAAGTAHAGPPTDWSAIKINRHGAKTIKAGADHGDVSTNRRRSDDDQAKKPGKAPAMTWRFGGPNRY